MSDQRLSDSCTAIRAPIPVISRGYSGNVKKHEQGKVEKEEVNIVYLASVLDIGIESILELIVALELHFRRIGHRVQEGILGEIVSIQFTG